MQESRDLAIKLFGKKIPLPSEDETQATISVYELALQSQASEGDLRVVDEDDDKEDSSNVSNPKTPSIYEENNNNSNNNNKEGAQKKILPCPRCNSMDTKFCYFNNYNVKQPRHLCKSCQRYWTAGGTIRSVPVGSGRRRSKSSGRSQASNSEGFKDPNIPQQWQQQEQDCSSSAAASPNFQFLSCNWWFPPLPPVVVGKRRQREQGEGVLVPKTLRMDDPSQVAKSSIWTTLGINKDGVEMMFQGFQPKNTSCDHYNGQNSKSNADYIKTSTHLLMANPAALSRSMNFHETS